MKLFNTDTFFFSFRLVLLHVILYYILKHQKILKHANLANVFSRNKLRNNEKLCIFLKVWLCKLFNFVFDF